MSVATKAALEDAIVNHFRSMVEDDNNERSSDVVIDWVVGFTISNVVDDDGEGSTVGYANGFDSADTNPNAQVYLAQWVSEAVAELLQPSFGEEDG